MGLLDLEISTLKHFETKYPEDCFNKAQDVALMLGAFTVMPSHHGVSKCNEFKFYFLNTYIRMHMGVARARVCSTLIYNAIDIVDPHYSVSVVNSPTR